MCCFARAIQSVTDTMIFARINGNGGQYLAYQMKYKSAEPNAMILPLPVALPAAEDDVRFIDLSEYDDIFEDLSSAFPYVPPRQLGCAMLPTAAVANDALLVHKVGNFIASFVPTMDDFSRLDEQFVIPTETWQKIPHYRDYGFAVFQLKELAGKPHPMAFEFKTRLNDIFFPTVHIHDGQVHSHEDFDHSLFLQHAGFDSIAGRYQGPRRPDRYTGIVRSKDVAGKYCNIEKAQGILAADLLLHRIDLNGKLENRDMTYHSAGSPLVPHFSAAKLLRYWPWAIPALAAAWLLNRRNQLLSQRNIAAETGPDTQSSAETDPR